MCTSIVVLEERTWQEDPPCSTSPRQEPSITPAKVHVPCKTRPIIYHNSGGETNRLFVFCSIYTGGEEYFKLYSRAPYYLILKPSTSSSPICSPPAGDGGRAWEIARVSDVAESQHSSVGGGQASKSGVDHVPPRLRKSTGPHEVDKFIQRYLSIYVTKSSERGSSIIRIVRILVNDHIVWHCRPYARTSASQAILSRMQLTLHTARQTPDGASRLGQAMSPWSVKTQPAPSRHCRDARVYQAIRLRPCITMSTPPHRLSKFGLFFPYN